MAFGTGTGNVAIGYNALIPSGSNWINTAIVGTGSATTEGWFHYRGVPVISPTGTIPAANVTGSIGVHRYLAFDDTGFEIMVTASATGITATTVGSTVTFTVPAGVVMLKAKIRIPSGITAPITLAGLPGTSDIDRTTVSVAVYYDAAGTTGAQITTAAGQEVVANVNQWKVLGHDATKAVVICAEFQ